MKAMVDAAIAPIALAVSQLATKPEAKEVDVNAIVNAVIAAMPKQQMQPVVVLDSKTGQINKQINFTKDANGNVTGASVVES